MNKNVKPLVALAALLILLPQAALARPGPTNTGPTSPDDQLVKMSDTTITKDGTVLEGVWISGTLNIQANNVTVRNFKVSTSAPYGVNANSGYTGLTLEDGEISGMQSAAIYGGNFTARRLEIHDSGADGIKPTGNVLIEDNWLHRLGYVSDAHADGVQVVSGRNIVIRGNYFDMIPEEAGFKNSQCMIIQTNIGTIDDVLIEGNWINGGGYSVQIRDKKTGYGAPTNVRILNNRFGRGNLYGPWITDGEVLKSGNVWDDTGALLDNQSTGGGGEPPPPVDPEPELGQASAPDFSRAGGNFLQPQTVSLSSATQGASIYYTINGSAPTSSSTKYTQPLSVNSTTTLKAVAIADGMTVSSVSDETYVFDTFASSNTWGAIGMDRATKSVKIEFDVTVGQAPIDSVVGLSSGPSESYSDLAVIVRFANSGLIDARNGSVYQALNTLAYKAGVKYRITITADVEAGVYSAVITPAGGAPVLIADQFSFRSEQASVPYLDNFAFTSIGGNSTISNISIGDYARPMPPTMLRIQ